MLPQGLLAQLILPHRVTLEIRQPLGTLEDPEVQVVHFLLPDPLDLEDHSLLENLADQLDQSVHSLQHFQLVLLLQMLHYLL